MKDLAILLRCMQLYSHNAHNVVQGPNFLEDHAFLGELYPIYETIYDSIIERMMGLDQIQPEELIDIQVKAIEHIKSIGINTDDIFETLLVCEQELQSVCSKVKGSIGTMNLLGQIADDSEVRTYKLKQKLK